MVAQLVLEKLQRPKTVNPLKQIIIHGGKGR